MSDRRLNIVVGSDVECREVRWLMPPYIPLGKLTLLEGDPASGKTFVALEFAAAVTSGRPITGGIPVEGGEPGTQSEPRNVLYCSGEDDMGDTLLPRFLKQNGDKSRFFAIDGMIREAAEKEIREHFTLAHVPELEAALETYRPALVVIDPLQAFIGKHVDMNRANEIRPIMAGLAEVAAKYDCAVLLVRHLNKSTAQRASQRGLGSIDFTAAARSVLLCGKHPDLANAFALVHQKSSMTKHGSALTFAIDGTGLRWTGTDDITGDMLLGSTRSEYRRGRVEAESFIRDLVADGPKPVEEVRKAARTAGLAPYSINRAMRSAEFFRRPGNYQGCWMVELAGESAAA